MNTVVSTKALASKVAKIIETVIGRDCDIIRDSGSWRVSNNTISSTVFANAARLAESGVKISEITESDLTA